MSETKSFPYETRLDIAFKALEVIDEKGLADACAFKWYNQTLCQVNQSVVRLGVVQGEYHWHKHDADDEFFYVVEAGFSLTWKVEPSSFLRGTALWFRNEFCIAPGLRSVR
jgi:uncharacterized cupin superfamily protein